MKVAASILASALMLSDSQIANAATATFGTGTDITGQVTVESGTIDVSINLSKMNLSLLPNGTNCLTGGLRYHIHSKWNHTDTKDYLTSNCSSDYTGGHYDPWIACSSSTSNTYCTVKDDDYSCVNGSSAWLSGSSGYSCNTTNYEENPYVCEVGDWSGKYGYLDVDTNTLEASATHESAWEVDSSDLSGLSIVFHCNNNDRAFCAPFEETSDNDDTSDRTTQSTATSQVATFTDLNNSTVILKNDNTYEINFNVTGLATLGCDELVYRVYNSWTQTNIVPNPTAAPVVPTPTAPTTPSPTTATPTTATPTTGTPTTTTPTTATPTTATPTTGSPTTATPTTATPTTQSPSPPLHRRLQLDPTTATPTTATPTTATPTSPTTTATPTTVVPTTVVPTTAVPTTAVPTTATPTTNTNTTAAAVPTSSPTNQPTASPVMNCSAIVGSFYDPTVTCARDTEKTQYCKNVGIDTKNDKLCSDPKYSYDCNMSDPYSCAPGDLSGKYGSIDTTTTQIYVNDGTDELMISLELLSGKSVVLQCADTYEILACAQFEDYSSNSSGGSSSSDDGSSSDWWVWLIVAIGVILLIGGGFWVYKHGCSIGDGYSRVN